MANSLQNAPKKARKNTTMKDVALLAGVHYTSVSVVMNGSRSSAGISAATRQRILDAAAELGYRRNGSAHTVKTGRFGSVALLLSPKQHSSYLPQQLLGALHDTLAEAGNTLTVCQLPDEKLTGENELPKVLRERMCDGLLIDYNSQFPASMAELIREQQIPAVWINTKQAQDSVYPDDFEAGARATNALLKLGHTRILYCDFTTIWGSSSEHYSSRDRSEGYLMAMKNAGCEPSLVRAQHIPKAERMTFCEQLLSGPNRPTAAIAYTQWSAFPLGFALAKLGLSLPTDFSMVSFGPTRFDCLNTEIDTFIEPQIAVAKLAVQTVFDKIADPMHSIASRSVPFDFHPGRSTAPP